jgi:hypothetical protein
VPVTAQPGRARGSLWTLEDFGIWSQVFHVCVGIRKDLKSVTQMTDVRVKRSSPKFPSLLLQCRQCRTQWSVVFVFCVRQTRKNKQRGFLYVLSLLALQGSKAHSSGWLIPQMREGARG